MKLERYFLLMILFFLSVQVYAQQKTVTITGAIIEEGTNQPVEQATVRLLGSKDSSMVGGVASSKNGTFTLRNIKPGNYLLHGRNEYCRPLCKRDKLGFMA